MRKFFSQARAGLKILNFALIIPSPMIRDGHEELKVRPVDESRDAVLEQFVVGLVGDGEELHDRVATRVDHLGADYQFVLQAVDELHVELAQ